MLPIPGISLLSQGLPFYGDDPSVFYADFTTGRVWDGANGVELTLDDVLTNTNATPQWVLQSSGGDKPIAANELPWSDLGMQAHVARSNLLANPDAPATQNVALTVATAAHNFVFWMRGTGSVTVAYVSGNALLTAPAGSATDGVFRFFRVPVGTTTVSVTVTGSVTFFQLEDCGAVTGSIAWPTAPIHGQQARAVNHLRTKGALTAALKQAEQTVYFEMQEPPTSERPLAVNNRRLIRASDGTTANIFTMSLGGNDVLNSSHTVASSSQFNLTITASATKGAKNGYWAIIKANAFRVALSGVEIQPDNAGTPNMGALTQFQLFGRDDNDAEACGGYITRLVIFPRGLEDARLVPFDPTPSVPPPYVTYDAITTTGGNAGTLHTITTFGSVNAFLHGSGARKVVIDPSLQGVDNANASPVQINSGSLTWRGHKHYIGGLGGNINVIGSAGAANPSELLFEDLHLLAGDGVPGRPPDSRDALTIQSGKNIVIRNCVFAFSIDECFDAFLSAGYAAENLLFDYFMGLVTALRSPGPDRGGPQQPLPERPAECRHRALPGAGAPGQGFSGLLRQQRLDRWRHLLI
jgi:hypothetical protein